MNTKKILLLPEKEIGKNLKAVISKMGLTQEQFGGLIGKSKTAVSSFVNASAGCAPSNLFQEIVTLGVNGNWYLTGEGEMFSSKIVGEINDAHYVEVGKAAERLFELLNKKAPEGSSEA